MIKIFHTADVHIGLEFKNYSNNLLLKEQRINVVGTMVNLANEMQADLFVIAGDLFDRLSVKKQEIQDTVNHLKNFKGKAVIVLPGNHDFLSSESSFWKDFQRYSENSNVKIIIPFYLEPIDLQGFGLKAIAYPAPCDSKHSETHRIGWIKNLPKDPSLFHIGIAHGTIEGVSLDDRGKYFKMGMAELKSAGMDIWLIGHAHVPFPDKPDEKHFIFNPGVPEPEEITRNHPGYAFFHEINAEKRINTTLLETGRFKFQRLHSTIQNARDIENLKKLAGPDNVLDLILTGKLEKPDFELLQKTINSLRQNFLHLSVENNCRLQLNQETILSEFPDQSFPHLLLTALQNDETALQLAFEILEECK